MKVTKQARREAKQLFRLCLVNGLIEEKRARQVVQQIIAAKPRGYLATLSYFQRLVELDCARHTAKVESALALPADFVHRQPAGHPPPGRMVGDGQHPPAVFLVPMLFTEKTLPQLLHCICVPDWW